MESKLIFFDIDDTLVDPRTHHVPESTLEALDLLKKGGHKIAVSTGRACTDESLRDIPDEVRNYPWDGWVACNGQFVYDGDMQPLFEKYMTEADFRKIFEICTREQFCLEITTENSVYCVTDMNEYTVESYKYFNIKMHEIHPYHGERIMNGTIFGPKDRIHKTLGNIPGLELTDGASAYVDIGPEGITKASGNRYFANILGYSEYIAFGDSANDVDMIRDAQIGVAMGQGTEEAKSAADIVTDTIDRNGVWNACVRIGLLERKTR